MTTTFGSIHPSHERHDEESKTWTEDLEKRAFADMIAVKHGFVFEGTQNPNPSAVWMILDAIEEWGRK